MPKRGRRSLAGAQHQANRHALDTAKVDARRFGVAQVRWGDALASRYSASVWNDERGQWVSGLPDTRPGVMHSGYSARDVLHVPESRLDNPLLVQVRGRMVRRDELATYMAQALIALGQRHDARNAKGRKHTEQAHDDKCTCEACVHDRRIARVQAEQRRRQNLAVATGKSWQ